jgi:hypothetical protein
MATTLAHVAVAVAVNDHVYVYVAVNGRMRNPAGC